MRKPITILYALGTGGKAAPHVIYGESPEQFREMAQRAENERAAVQGREPETVYLWEPLKTDVINRRLLK